MKEIQFLEWTFSVEEKETESIYSSIEKGSAERCRCSLCENYLANKHTLFPRKVVDFFIASGIDIDKDYEIIQIGKENDQLHLYGAWFNFIGQQTSGPECKEPHANGGFSTKYFDLTDNFSIAFISGNKPFAESYFDKVEQPVVEVNLLFKIPWVIQAEEP